MIIEVSLKHIPMQAEMWFDAATEGWRVGSYDLPVVVPLMRCHPLSYGLGLSAIRAAAASNGLDDLDLFAVFADNEMTDEDGAIGAGVGAFKAGVMRLYGVAAILSGWVRVGCARLCGGHEDAPSWSGLRGAAHTCGANSFPTTPWQHESNYDTMVLQCIFKGFSATIQGKGGHNGYPNNGDWRRKTAKATHP
jgi:hypothetical protein